MNFIERIFSVSGKFVRRSSILFIAVFVWFCARSIYSEPPLRPADVVIFVARSDSGVAVLTEVRKYVGVTAMNVTITRYLYEEANPKNFFIIEGGTFPVLEGEFPHLHTVVLPPWVLGRWCSALTMTWWPSWSQREFELPTKDVCFETSDYE